MHVNVRCAPYLLLVTCTELVHLHKKQQQLPRILKRKSSGWSSNVTWHGTTDVISKTRARCMKCESTGSTAYRMALEVERSLLCLFQQRATSGTFQREKLIKLINWKQTRFEKLSFDFREFRSPVSSEVRGARECFFQTRIRKCRIEHAHQFWWWGRRGRHFHQNVLLSVSFIWLLTALVSWSTTAVHSQDKYSNE